MLMTRNIHRKTLGMALTNTKRREFLKLTGALGATAKTSFAWVKQAEAHGLETMVVASGQTIMSLNLHWTGTNLASYQVDIDSYDRLVGFGSRQLPTGEKSYDYDTIAPELAESWTISEDGLVFTFTLKADATFTNGTPVTAADAKWSFNRAMLVGGFPTIQMAAGGFFRPDQFEALDATTFMARLDYPSKLSLPNLAVPVPFIIISTVAMANATEADPWATEYLHANTASSGAYTVARWDQDQ